MIRARSTVFLLAALGGCGAGFEPPPIDTPPDDAVRAFITSGNLPAVAVAVVIDGETVYRTVAGVRKKGDPTPAAPADAFHIGSNTKAMTALVAGTVVDAGLISWDATAGDVLAGTVPVGASYRTVTLAQFLSHTSGMPEIPGTVELSFNASSSPTDVQRREIVKYSLAMAPRSEPGSAFFYSNVNYVVAGLMLEVAAGESWETMLAERIFAPLGMAHAGLGVPATPGTVDAPWGHNPSPVQPALDMAPGFGPAGRVHANLDDLIAYVRLYFDRGMGPTGRIISEASLDEMESPRVEHYGFGWFTGRNDVGDLMMFHNGSIGSFYSYIEMYPEQRSALIAMTNAGDRPSWNRIGELCFYLAAHFGVPGGHPWADEAP
jgi:CubicO group peptidase (beta-lactamase class C family)